MLNDGIMVRVLGDYGPFSAMGKSIGYQVTIGESSFLVDCGSPLFQQIGGHGLKAIQGVIITHCHDDHKRWFTDLALFSRYAPDLARKLPVFTSDSVNEGLRASAAPALNTSLGSGSLAVVDLDYNDYIANQPLGPRARYHMVKDSETGCWQVVDSAGELVGPERAKVVISGRNGAPRLLFKDPDYGEWIEPEHFYPFSAQTFYHTDQRSYHADDGSFTITALNAPVWHGVPGIGLRISTADEAVVFSSDTAHDTELWQTLCREKRSQRLPGSHDEFLAASVLYGDINDYIERMWSHERYSEAIHAFDGAVVIHDIATRNSVVHTDYRRLAFTVLDRERTLLTHSPDKLTSAWMLSRSGKTFLIHSGTVSEMVAGRSLPLDAAVYHKEEGRFYVGFTNPHGAVTVFDHEGVLNLGGQWDSPAGKPLFRVDLYEDVGGKYLPVLASGGTASYVERPDGAVELVTRTPEGSWGVIVEDLRGRLGNR
jgi:ribonuclease BN (tRNA processing enzyme)